MRTTPAAGMFTGPEGPTAVARPSEWKVISLLCTLFVLACLIAVGVVVARPKFRRAVLEVVDRPAGPGAPAVAPTPNRSPQTLEGVLTRQLVTGEITGSQYRHAMASIAVRDAERHPLEVPPDAAPPEAA
jgi:hypothetical protein